jgi:hypothetical protein
MSVEKEADLMIKKRRTIFVYVFSFFSALLRQVGRGSGRDLEVPT